MLAAVEGITEFLPISSTGHLILAAKPLNIPQTEFVKTFEITLQLGAIFSIVFLYWKKLLTDLKIWQNILIAFSPTAVIGFTLYPLIKGTFLESANITLTALFFGGIALILLEIVYKEKDHHVDKMENLTIKQAFFIGLFQSVAVIPGISRSAATIIGALFMGAKRKTAVEFSFILAIPTMLAATLLDIAKTGAKFSTHEYSILGVGFAGAFIFALIAIKFLLQFIQTHTFIPFGIYRIILVLIFLTLQIY